MSRLDDLKDQNKNLNVSLIDILAHIDPSKTYKYVGFLIKLLKDDISGDICEKKNIKFTKNVEIGCDDVKEIIGLALFTKKNIEYIERFEKHSQSNRIKNNDITKYNSLDEIITEVNRADEMVKLKQSEKQVIKIYEDDDYLLIIPLTFDSSKIYGSNTKWCVTQETYWKQYQWKWRLIYIIEKKTNRKYAISKNYDDPNKIQGWLSDDKEANPMLFPIPEYVFSHIFKYLKMDIYEPELNILGDHSIMTEDGIILTIEEATTSQIKMFLSKFESRLTKPHLANLRSCYNRPVIKDNINQ